MPSVFDQPQGIMKADGQMHGGVQPAPAPMAPQGAPPTSSGPGIGDAIQGIIAALAHAMAPKAITDRKQNIDQSVQAASGDQSLGQQL